MTQNALVCRVGGLRVALPLDQVRKAMRPLPILPLAAAPPYVSGVSIIGDLPVPVVDMAALLGVRSEERPRRVVLVGLGDREVGLALDEVLGVQSLDPASRASLPPLLQGAAEQFLESIQALDGELLVALRRGLRLPDTVWQSDAREVDA